MSPVGRLNPASNARNANNHIFTHYNLILLLCVLSDFSISSKTLALAVKKPKTKITPMYDVDFDESVYNGFEGKTFSEALPPDAKISEQIIPIDVKGLELSKIPQDQFKVEEEEENVLDTGSETRIKTEIDVKNTVTNSDGEQVKEEIDIIVEKSEVETYCSTFESKCRCSTDGTELVCREAGFVEVPSSLPSTITKLDLRGNNITELKATSFELVPKLEELSLSDNKLESIQPGTFETVPKITKLSLHNCGLDVIPSEALKALTKLIFLKFKFLITNVKILTKLPVNLLRLHPLLKNLAYNKLSEIKYSSLPAMPHLEILLLRRNRITSIDERAFINMTSLKKIELDDNLLTDIPVALHHLPVLQELSLARNRIKYIGYGVLQKVPNLVNLFLTSNPLVGVDPHSFSFLPHLKSLILSDARDLTIFPSLNGTSALETLKIDRASLEAVPHTLCKTCTKLKTLDLKSNHLTRIPDLTNCVELRVLDLSSNYITNIEGGLFRNLTLLHDLTIPHNLIETIPREAFYGLGNLQTLNLEDNKITYIHPDAFLPISKIDDLNLGNNAFPHLPSKGLQRLLHLKTFNNPYLKEFHIPETFPRIQTLVLSYAYHCCAFLPLIEGYGVSEANDGATEFPVKETILFPSSSKDKTLWSNNQTNVWTLYNNMSHRFGSVQFTEMMEEYGHDFTYPINPEEYNYEEDNTVKLTADKQRHKTQCLPLPGPFLPCEDLFDWWTLRCGVWVVFLMAMLGNGTVVFVLIFSRSKMDVPRFLVCNLAAADFFMGIYLGFLAVVDASTLGEFRMYAIPWQMSAGCQLAGFLGVLSSELSVFTLAVITLERNYAITHAMHLNKRLSLKHAGYIMLIGWTFSLTMAMLPLFGISDYRKFAVCLPFETTNGPASLAYVVFLMFINGVAFLILMGCYLKMYCAIRGSQAWNSNDSRIAKRMALLVFTDFLCWSPIAFFSLTAAFGLQLISLEQAKVFTVFILPLNSCCNPFLYAILTKQFKKDCVLICKAIEESRVTRGIGRCRHSSNFSNRQTPANTNSLVDRSSREHQQHHPPACSCSAKLLSDSGGVGTGANNRNPRSNSAKNWFIIRARNFFNCLHQDSTQRHRTRSDQYAYQIAEIQQKQHKRASSVSSSENFSSSRSDSWRHNHHCGIPLRLLDPKRRASSWLVSRKTSQDSNLSSSRNDSSGSATTASTSTWRMSRSSASSEPPRSRTKPRLTRQHAIRDELIDPPGSPGRLTVRFLTTIPSCAETSMQLDEEPPSPSKQDEQNPANIEPEPVKAEETQSEPMYAVLHANSGSPLTTLHPAKDLPLDAEQSKSNQHDPT